MEIVLQLGPVGIVLIAVIALALLARKISRARRAARVYELRICSRCDKALTDDTVTMYGTEPVCDSCAAELQKIDPNRLGRLTKPSELTSGTSL